MRNSACYKHLSVVSAMQGFCPDRIQKLLTHATVVGDYVSSRSLPTPGVFSKALELFDKLPNSDIVAELTFGGV